MRPTLISSNLKKGTPRTLYNARLNFNQIKNVPSMLKLKSQLFKIDRNIGFAYFISDTRIFDDNSLTKYGLQLLGSQLSYQLPSIDINFSILSNLYNLPALCDNAMEQELPKSLPVTKLNWDYDICEHASISKHKFLQKVKVNHTESQYVEKSTRNKGNQKNGKNTEKTIDLCISP